MAGPVVAAAVWLDPKLDPSLFNDSKQVTASDRERFFAILQASNSWIGVGVHSHRWIDQVNVLNATLSAMTRAVQRLPGPVTRCLIDGNRVPPALRSMGDAIVGGDATVPCISAASIVAKVTRDRIMVACARIFSYRFDRHKGYATAAHYAELAQYGPTVIHRRSFNLSVQDRLF